jgi:PAS domain S-box-containing protein
MLRPKLPQLHIVSAIILIAFFFGLAVSPILAHNEAEHVLVLDSYHKGFYWSDGELEGIQSVLPDDVILTVEYVDTKRLSDGAYLNSLYEIYKRKYQNVEFDCVIALDDDAFEFALQHHDSLFPDAPLVFGGVNHFKDSTIVGRNDVTGVAETIDHTESFYQQYREIIWGVVAFVIVQASVIAYLVANIFHRRRMEEALQQRVAQLALLNDIGNQIATIQELDRVLARVAHLVQRSFGYHHVGLFTLNPEDQSLVMRAKSGSYADLFPKNHQLKLGEGMVGWVGLHNQTLLANDVCVEPRHVNPFPEEAGEVTKSELSVPIQVAGEVVGVLDIQSLQLDAFDDSDVMVMRTLADQIAVAIENARLYEAIQQELGERKRTEETLALKVSQLATLSESSQAVTASLELNQVLAEIVSLASKVVASEHASVVLVDESGDLDQSAESLEGVKTINHRVRENGLTYWITSTGQAAIIDDIAPDGTIVPDLGEGAPRLANPVIVETGVKSVVGLPLRAKDHLLGVLYMYSTRPKAFEGLLPVLATFANQAAIAVENARLHQTVQQELAERVRVQEERERLLAQIQEHAQQVQQIIETVPDGMIMLDADKRILLTNPTAEEFLPLLTEATVGEVLLELGGRQFDELLKPPAEGTHSHEVKIKQPQFHIFEIEPQRIEGGLETGGWVVVLRDVTEERLAQERAQQQQRMAAVGQLAAGIAHDFNNILTSIIGFAELMRSDEILSHTSMRDVEQIIRQGHRAANLIRQILDFSRKSIIERRTINLTSFLKETVKLLERTIPENIRIVLDMQLGDRTCLLNADLTQIQQALTNLAVNARDAMPQGGELKFHLSCFDLHPNQEPPCPDMAPGEWMALSISDTGTGIEPHNLPRIFEPFFTTKEVGEGTGLGLAQVYGIVKQHEGFINAESKVGEGTTFTIYLPSLPTKEEDATSEPEDNGIPRGNGETILLVEDDLLVQQVAQAMLEHLGYRVVMASNGREALEVYDEHSSRIAMVLTDVTMPEMGGLALSEALHKKDQTIKIVALTGYPLEDEAGVLLAQGIMDWLHKPLDLQKLAQTVSRSLRPDSIQL